MKTYFLSLLVLCLSLLSGCLWKAEGNKGFYTEKHIKEYSNNYSPDTHFATGSEIVVASGGKLSSQVAQQIVAQGGNYIDVAIAVSLALGVEIPYAQPLGGGGFVTLYDTKKGPLFLDFREQAPLKAHAKMYFNDEGEYRKGASLNGGLAVGVPGYLAGMKALHKKLGKLPWKQLFGPAIKMATSGTPAFDRIIHGIKLRKKEIENDEATKSLLFPTDQQLKINDTLVQKDLAATYTEIAHKGPQSFYKGELAKKIVKAVNERGGIFQLKDLSQYQAKWRHPIVFNHKDTTIYTSPPPSAGGALMKQMTLAYQAYQTNSPHKKLDGASYYHLLNEIFHFAFSERARHIGDPDHEKLDLEKLWTSKTIDNIVKGINPKRHHNIDYHHHEDDLHGNTTQLCVMDKQGNAISITLTLNWFYGAIVTVPGTGILLNNEMDDFVTNPEGKNLWGFSSNGGLNRVGPKRRPVSSMSPTVLVKNNKATMALGGTGGSFIISNLFQFLNAYWNLYPEDLKKSLWTPRIHHQWKPDKLYLEKHSLSSLIQTGLKRRGHDLDDSKLAAKLQVVGINSQSKKLEAHSDPRFYGGTWGK